MTTVALETSARPPSIAARMDARIVSERLEHERRHASDLLPQLGALLDALGSSPREIRDVIVGTGPGSYTGLRVGIATALGLARGAGARLFGVPSFEALAYAEVEPEREAAILLDARAKELYFAHYRRTSNEVEAVVPPRVLRAEELGDLLPPGLPIFGDATVADAAHLDEEQRSRLRTDCVPSADALLELGLARVERDGTMRPEDVEPLYLRPFAAKVRRR